MTYAPNRYRTLFLSDFHLGSKHCKVQRLLEFIRSNDAEQIYLIGDIVDYKLGGWPPHHDEVLSALAQKALKGTKIIYIPGNHDHFFRGHLGTFANLQIMLTANHQLVDKRWLLVTHGDETDTLGLGSLLVFVIKLEKLVPIPLWEVLRLFLGRFIAWHTKQFEKKMRKRAKGYAGVICGHVHFPRVSVGYFNTGDWTHHCTAIGEHYDGTFELLKG